jgi:hypothetical protein
MKIIKPSFPFISVVFWLFGLILVMLFADRNSIFTYAFAFLPVHIIALTIRYITGKITISDNILSTKMSFDKYEVDLTKVKGFEVKKRNLFLQLLLGVPKEVTIVEYNKYDTIQLNSADPVLLEVLSKSVNLQK